MSWIDQHRSNGKTTGNNCWLRPYNDIIFGQSASEILVISYQNMYTVTWKHWLCSPKLFCALLEFAHDKTWMCPCYIDIFPTKQIFCNMIGCSYRWLHPVVTLLCVIEEFCYIGRGWTGGEVDCNTQLLAGKDAHKHSIALVS
jgi:hypothetical protein